MNTYITIAFNLIRLAVSSGSLFLPGYSIACHLSFAT